VVLKLSAHAAIILNLKGNKRSALRASIQVCGGEALAAKHLAGFPFLRPCFLEMNQNNTIGNIFSRE
jgi:hypothetical protein